MDALDLNMASPTAAALYQSRPLAAMSLVSRSGLSEGERSSSSGMHQNVRARVGEFVGSIFYGTLLREAQKSSLKGKYLHGGRGEEVFKGQLNEELARKLGRAQNNPVTDRLAREIERYLGATMEGVKQ
jgi:hypothetical protein